MKLPEDQSRKKSRLERLFEPCSYDYVSKLIEFCRQAAASTASSSRDGNYILNLSTVRFGSDNNTSIPENDLPSLSNVVRISCPVDEDEDELSERVFVNLADINPDLVGENTDWIRNYSTYKEKFDDDALERLEYRLEYYKTHFSIPKISDDIISRHQKLLMSLMNKLMHEKREKCVME